MTDALLADDPLYAELYDVRKEAEAMRNYVAEDQTEAIAALRAKAPVHAGTLRELLHLPEHKRHPLAEGHPKFCALSFAACEEVLRDSKRFTSAILHHPNPANEKTYGVLEMDGSEHRAFRRALQPIFLKHNAEGWWRTRWIDDSIAKLIDGLKQRETADLNLDYCARIPVHTITTAIGLDGDEALEFRLAWLNSSGFGRVPPEDQRAGAEKVESMLLRLIAARRAEPLDDVITRLNDSDLALPSEEPRKLSDREVMLNAKLIMAAGGGTSWRQMGVTLLALLTHRDQLEALKADRSLMIPTIEESARWVANSGMFCRQATQATEIQGFPVPEGAVIELWLSAANRDPSRWDEPDRFNIFRKPVAHLGFGIGQHRCLGLNVALQEMSAGISALLDAFPNMRLDPDKPVPFITGGLEQRGPSGLPVILGS